MPRVALHECAVVSLLRRDDGKILGISRGLFVDDIGLPGGRVDPTDPSLPHAATRELYEETGVLVHPGALRPVFEGPGGPSVKAVIAFVVEEAMEIPERPESIPFEGVVGWHPPAAFLSDSCSYQGFQHQLFQHLKIR